MGSSVSSTNVERRSSRRPSKKDFLIQIKESISQIRRQIEMDPNLEDHDGYNEKLSEYSQVLLEIKTKSKNHKVQSSCSRMLNEINSCHALIRETAEIRERNLDTAAIESNSFISQDIYRPRQNKKTLAERIKSLTTIESKIQTLDYEIRQYVLANDIKNLIILEKKVDILYRDLDEVKTPEKTQMAEKKAKLAEKLIKFRNKINVVKRKAGHVDAKDGQALSKLQLKHLNTEEYSLSMLSKVEKELNELKQRCSTFEGCAEDASYKELYNQLRQQYTTLSNLAISSDRAQQKVTEINSIIRKTLAQLSVKARENEEAVALNLSKIASLDKDIDLCRQKLEGYFGSSSHLAHYNQKLTEIESKVSGIAFNNPQVSVNKDKVLDKLEKVQQICKAKMDDLGGKKQILAKVKNFENSWRELISSETALRESKPIMNILSNVAASLNHFLKEKGDYNARMIKAHSTEFMDQLMDEIASNSYKRSRSAENLKKRSDEVIYSNYLVHQQLLMEINSEIAQLEGKISNFQRMIGTMQGTKLSEEYKKAKFNLEKYRGEVRAIRPQDASIVQNKEKLLKVLDEAARQLEYKAEQNSVRTPLVVRSYELPKPLNLSDQQIMSNLPLTPTTPKRASIFNSSPNISQVPQSVPQSRASIGEPSVLYSIPTPWLKKPDEKKSTDTLNSMYETKLRQIDQALVQMPRRIDKSSKAEEATLKRELENLQSSLESLQDVDENMRFKKQRVAQNVNAMLQYLNNKVRCGTGTPTRTKLSDKKIEEDYAAMKKSGQVITFNMPPTPTIPKKDSIFNSSPNVSQLHQNLSKSRENIGEPSKLYSTPYPKRPDEKPSTDILGSMYETKLGQIDQALLQMPSRIDESSKAEEATLRHELENLQSSLGSVREVNENLRPTKHQTAQNVNDMLKYLDNKAVEPRQGSNDISTRATLSVDELYSAPQAQKAEESQAANESLSQLEKINEEFKDLAKKIDAFHGTKDDTEFCILDETLLALMLKVDKVKTYRIPAVKEQRKGILQNMNKYNAILEEKTKPQNHDLESTSEIANQINSIRTKVANLGNKISGFRGQRNDVKYEELDQRLLDLFLELDGIDTKDDGSIKEAKETVLREIQEQMGLLEEKVSSDETDSAIYENVGTFV